MTKRRFSTRKRRTVTTYSERTLSTTNKAALDQADTRTMAPKRQNTRKAPPQNKRARNGDNHPPNPTSPSTTLVASPSDSPEIQLLTKENEKLHNKIDKINKEKSDLIEKLAQLEKDNKKRQKIIDELLANPKLSKKKKKEVEAMLQMEAKSDVTGNITSKCKEFLIRKIPFTPNPNRLEEACVAVQELLADKSDPKIFFMTYSKTVRSALFQAKSDQTSAGKTAAERKYIETILTCPM